MQVGYNFPLVVCDRGSNAPAVLKIGSPSLIDLPFVCRLGNLNCVIEVVHGLKVLRFF